MLRRSWLIFVLGFCATSWCAAETVYVTDRLYLGLYEGDGGTGKKLASLVSGTALKVLNDGGPAYRNVETDDGLQGWVKGSYLVSDKPAVLVVQESENQIALLANTLEDTQQQLAAAELKATQYEVDYNNAREEILVLQDLREENKYFHEKLDAYMAYIHFGWLVAGMLMSLLAGIISGLWILDRSMRRRHEGYRVY